MEPLVSTTFYRVVLKVIALTMQVSKHVIDQQPQVESISKIGGLQEGLTGLDRQKKRG